MGKQYDPQVYNDCKRKFMEYQSPREISEGRRGKPSRQCVQKWANEVPAAGPHQGKNWYKQREERRDKMFDKASPQKMASKILDRIYELLTDPEFETRSADAMVKLQKMAEKLLDPKFQVPIMYHMLERQILFFKKHHKDLVDKEFLLAIQDFKNDLRSHLETEHLNVLD